MACECEYKVVGKNGLGRQLVKECDECKAKREAQNVVSALQNEKQELLMFLTSTDWKMLRHRDELELNEETSLTSEEYNQLLIDRNEARIRTNEIEADADQAHNNLQPYFTTNYIVKY